MSPVVLSPAHFSLLQRVIRTVSRLNRLSPEDAEDFGQTVHLKLLERNYYVFNSYEGRSSLSTFLTVVVTRLLLDWRNATRGKWRPSASAVRLGSDAVTLERLMHRDGMTRAEAIATVRSLRRGRNASVSEELLDDLVDRLPPRTRRVFVTEIAEESLGHRTFDDPILASEQREMKSAVRRALRQACADLEPEERQLLALRYVRAYSVRAIGDALQVEAKPLYRRIDRILATLRHRLAALGVSAAPAVADLN